MNTYVDLLWVLGNHHVLTHIQMLCVYIHVQSIQSSFILNFFYKLLHSLKKWTGRVWASFYVSKENNIHPYATLVYKFNSSTYSGLIVEIVALHHSKPRCDCFEHDQNNRAYGTIFKYSYTSARHSHCTRTNIRNKSFKFVRKSQNFTVLTMLRISYGLPRVFYEFLRFFLESSGLSSEWMGM